jgi:hypothetical protein
MLNNLISDKCKNKTIVLHTNLQLPVNLAPPPAAARTEHCQTSPALLLRTCWILNLRVLADIQFCTSLAATLCPSPSVIISISIAISLLLSRAAPFSNYRSSTDICFPLYLTQVRFGGGPHSSNVSASACSSFIGAAAADSIDGTAGFSSSARSRSHAYARSS